MFANKDWRISTTRCDPGLNVQCAGAGTIQCIVVPGFCS